MCGAAEPAKLQSKTPILLGMGVLGIRSRRFPTFAWAIHTIIGVTSFHGPVRDGKAWYQGTMVVEKTVSDPLLRIARRVTAFLEVSKGTALDCFALSNYDLAFLKVIESSLTSN